MFLLLKKVITTYYLNDSWGKKMTHTPTITKEKKKEKGQA